MKNLRYLSYLIFGAILSIGSTVFAVNTASEYLIVKDLPFIGPTTSLGSYLTGIFQLGIGVAVTLAVVMLVINGIQYMFSDIPGVKVSAKNNLGNIVWGLILAFSSWLILYTINPHLIKFDLIKTIDDAVNAVAEPPPGTPLGEEWPDDSSVRATLSAAGIGINNANCTNINQKGCTSVYGLKPHVIEGLINLKERCKCNVTITGGTEYWLHKTHANNDTVDLRSNGTGAGLTTYIGGPGTACYEKKDKDGLRFQWEDNQCGPDVFPHWHITF